MAERITMRRKLGAPLPVVTPVPEPKPEPKHIRVEYFRDLPIHARFRRLHPSQHGSNAIWVKLNHNGSAMSESDFRYVALRDDARATRDF